MPTTRELHRQAMELLDEALYVAESEPGVENLFRRALHFEASAADSVSDRLELEPTRSVLHRGAASLALRIGDVEIAKRYIATALQGRPPTEIRHELDEIYSQALMREALTKKSRKPSRVRPAEVRNLVRETIDRYTAQIPVDIRGMVQAFGLTLYRESMGANRGMIERNLRKGGFSGYRIVVNQEYPVEDQRVATAHELSHYMKDRDRFTDRLTDDRMYKSDLKTFVEDEADRVALHWLIPGDQLEKKRKEVGYDNAEELARVFRVPLLEMKMRMGIIRRRIRWSDV